MVARIYKPARTATQSGYAKANRWVLDFDPERPRVVEPLMGWTSSTDMKQQLRLFFATREEAVAYAERNAIPHKVFEPKEKRIRTVSYSDNFRFDKREPWSH